MEGLIAGYIGAICVYPIDLLKSNSQMANKIKINHTSQLYSGILIQLAGVGPEKAIKIYTNKYLSNIGLHPILSGAFAGLSQVLISNPIENIKLQYQLNHNTKMTLKQSLQNIGGITKLYRGSTACALRDIPFNALYWPLYSYLRNQQQSGIVSGMIAAIPAAFLVTPMDVIKTRLQARPDLYKNIPSTAIHIWKAEGIKGMFRGGLWRICKSSPQFAITLGIYEMLTNLN